MAGVARVAFVLALVPASFASGWQLHSLPFDASSVTSRNAQLPRRQAWGLTQPGTTGVAAMQLTVVSPTQILIVDKVERNPLLVNGHSAWSALYNTDTNTVRPVDVVTNSFCAGGAWLSNGTLLNVGGNAVLDGDLGDKNGAQGLRMFTPSHRSGENRYLQKCVFFESPNRIRLGVARWYPTVVRLDDGSVFIIGGSLTGVFENSAAANVPSIEFWPPKNVNGHNGTPVPSQFLQDTLNANLFPIAILLPAGRIFVAANQKAMIYDWRLDLEIRLPDLPNGVRISYPMAGTGVLLPLSPDNGYTPTVLICGGSAHSDSPTVVLSSQDTASAQCARMELSVPGIRAGWLVETMPEPRIMPDVVQLPDGRLLIVNGGRTGYSGTCLPLSPYLLTWYGNVLHQVGASNADNPVLRPVIYDPAAAEGSRFSTAGLPTSTIPRLYHSVASLLPSGAIVIAGSNPNEDVSTVKYATEYRLEILSPPWMTAARPTFTGLPPNANFGTNVTLTIAVPASLMAGSSVALMDLGYSTHALHMNMRHVWLNSARRSNTTLVVTIPPNPTIYPPGPGWLYVVANGTPSKGQQLLVGTGGGPRVDTAAWAKYAPFFPSILVLNLLEACSQLRATRVEAPGRYARCQLGFISQTLRGPLILFRCCEVRTSYSIIRTCSTSFFFLRRHHPSKSSGKEDASTELPWAKE
ncbi:hypothetical protein AURDEDRAFT_64772 [Auricularia subglabra TFB-10046 SS5]|nr:hypothetical protein AURDEDRAFT_64772 [Auricularia subglabra TFB-10046 SS5]